MQDTLNMSLTLKLETYIDGQHSMGMGWNSMRDIQMEIPYFELPTGKEEVAAVMELVKIRMTKEILRRLKELEKYSVDKKLVEGD